MGPCPRSGSVLGTEWPKVSETPPGLKLLSLALSKPHRNNEPKEPFGWASGRPHVRMHERSGPGSTMLLPGCQPALEHPVHLPPCLPNTQFPSSVCEALSVCPGDATLSFAAFQHTPSQPPVLNFFFFGLSLCWAILLIKRVAAL